MLIFPPNVFSNPHDFLKAIFSYAYRLFQVAMKIMIFSSFKPRQPLKTINEFLSLIY